MENLAVSTILTQDKQSIKVHLTVLGNNLELSIFHNEAAWKSNVSQQQVTKFAEEHKISVDNYCQVLLSYIKYTDEPVSFSFKNQKFIINKVLNKSLKVNFFVTTLEKVNYTQQAEKLISNLYNISGKLSDESSKLKSENIQITAEKQECENKLEALVKKSINDQEEQFGHFLQILNEKKRHILHLTELLEAYKSGSRNAVKKTDIIPQATTSSEDSVDENTSEDETEVKVKAKVPSPSTSKADELLEFINGDSDEGGSHLLPKRMKTIEEDLVLKLPPKEATPPPVQIERSKSPQIDISTQQLLDMF